MTGNQRVAVAQARMTPSGRGYRNACQKATPAIHAIQAKVHHCWMTAAPQPPERRFGLHATRVEPWSSWSHLTFLAFARDIIEGLLVLQAVSGSGAVSAEGARRSRRLPVEVEEFVGEYGGDLRGVGLR